MSPQQQLRSKFLQTPTTKAYSISWLLISQLLSPKVSGKSYATVTTDDILKSNPRLHYHRRWLRVG